MCACGRSFPVSSGSHAAYVITSIDAVPSIDDEGVDSKPIQHYFRLTAFGINVYRATAVGDQVIGDHDERGGRHEEVYVVLHGSVRFTVGDDEVVCSRGSLVVVKDPTVRRGAVAETADAAVLAVGNREGDRFETTWRPEHFRGVPTYDEDNPS
jgi:quercetin dioxygenase-like cupin family protein